MAERRMFAKTIIDSDAFLDMPMSARLLYYDLGMRADDDGFINSPKKIMRTIGATTDDMNILIARKFVIPFDSGVVVIKAWRINNYLRSDRYNETKYIDEKAQLDVDKTGMYHLNDSNGIPSGIPTVDTGKVSIGKDSIGKVNNKIYPSSFDEFWQNYPRKQDKGQAYKCYQARLNDGYNEDQLLTACINYAAECDHDKREKKYIKVASTFLSVNEPFVEYLDKGDGANERLERRTVGDSKSKSEYEAEMLEAIRRWDEDDE